MKQHILAVSGVKNSGKTTLLTKLIPLLAEHGLKCAVIKHDGHSFAADREGTDTERMLAAGAFGAAVFDGEKFQAVKKQRVSENDLIGLYPEADLILLEGFKYSDHPKIEIVRREAGCETVSDPETLIALVTDCVQGPPGTPVFRPEEYGRIADFIARWAKAL